MAAEINNSNQARGSGTDLIAFNASSSRPPIKTLPAEIWCKIFSYLNLMITPSTPWEEIVNYLCVSKAFFDICLTSIDRFRIYHVLKRSKIPATMPTQLTKIPFEGAILSPRTFSSAQVGNTEKRYITMGGNSPTLSILSASAAGFEWSSVNTKKSISNFDKEILKNGRNLIDNLYSRYGFFDIIDCHPTEKGFIIVMKGGIGIWEEEKGGKPTLHSFYSPFLISLKVEGQSRTCYNTKGYRVINSTYQNGILYLTTSFRSYELNFYKIDLHQEEPHFIQLSPLKDVHGAKLHYAPNALLLISWHDDHEKANIFIRKITINERDIEYIPDEPHIESKNVGHITLSSNEVRAVNNWILITKMVPVQQFLLPDSDVLPMLNIYDSNTMSLWIGDEMNLMAPDPFFDEHLFFMGDFLCLTYRVDGRKKRNNHLRIIHLPTKKEYTKIFAPFLKPYPNQKDRVLSGLYLQNKYESLHLLWHDRNRVEKIKFKSVQIPIVQDMSDETCSSLSTLKCDFKVMMVAGVALALITLVATLALVFTHPGTILVQHQGFTLTLPTIVTLFTGEGIALIVISVGVYRHKRQRPIQQIMAA